MSNSILRIAVMAALLCLVQMSSTGASTTATSTKRRKMKALEFWLEPKATAAHTKLDSQRALSELYSMASLEALLPHSMSLGDVAPGGTSAPTPFADALLTSAPTNAATMAPTFAPTAVPTSLVPLTTAPTAAPVPSVVVLDSDPNESIVSEGSNPTVQERGNTGDGVGLTWVVVATLAVAVAAMAALFVARRRRRQVPKAGGFSASGGGSSISSASRLVEV